MFCQAKNVMELSEVQYRIMTTQPDEGKEKR